MALNWAVAYLLNTLATVSMLHRQELGFCGLLKLGQSVTLLFQVSPIPPGFATTERVKPLLSLVTTVIRLLRGQLSTQAHEEGDITSIATGTKPTFPETVAVQVELEVVTDHLAHVLAIVVVEEGEGIDNCIHLGVRLNSQTNSQL
ncbi:hypothetical protein [Spirosoma horti]